jgi:hypothetical protein
LIFIRARDSFTVCDATGKRSERRAEKSSASFIRSNPQMKTPLKINKYRTSRRRDGGVPRFAAYLLPSRVTSTQKKAMQNAIEIAK